jgi:hypothetical protein
MTLHAASAPILPDAFLTATTPPPLAPALDSDSAATTLQGDEDEDGTANAVKPAGITVQLSGGVLVVRRLRCGLLFVCVGPAEAQQQPRESSRGREATPTTASESISASGSGSPDDRESVLSVAGSSVSVAASVRAQGVVAIRRQSEELARMLDEKLGALRIPEDGVVGAD